MLSDRKRGMNTSASATTATHYEAVVQSATDYYAFGQEMPGRTFTADGYRFGFNGKENEKDWGTQLIQDYGFRLYNPGLGRFLSVDPLATYYPELSPFGFAGNSPILFIDYLGADPEPVSAAQFRKLANLIFSAITNKKVGAIFEEVTMLSMKSANFSRNTKVNFFSDYRKNVNYIKGGPLTVRPDAYYKTLGADTKERLFVIPHFVEAKVTTSTFTVKYRQSQLSGMIDALANITKISPVKPTGKVKGWLTIVATKDATFSADLIKFASDRGILLRVAFLTYDDETKQFEVTNPITLNFDQIYQSAPATTVKGEDLLKKYGFKLTRFNTVNPEDVNTGYTPSDSDPDKAEYNDQ